MKFTTSSSMTLNLFAFFLTFFALLSNFVVQAAPLAEKRDVFVPHITYPQEGTVWQAGQKVTITWDTSDAPEQITNRNGMILLRKGNLSTPLVLAGNFDILKGKVKITVPQVLADDDYSIVLFGDSGNFSPQITINSDFDF